MDLTQTGTIKMDNNNNLYVCKLVSHGHTPQMSRGPMTLLNYFDSLNGSISFA